MWNAWLDESQPRIKSGRRNTKNLRYANSNILMAENEEEIKSLLMRVKEESEKAGLKLNIQKMKIMALLPSLHGKYIGEKMETVVDFIFLGSTEDDDCGREIKMLAPWEKS